MEEITLKDIEGMGKVIRRKFMDRTTRMVNELKRVVKTSEMKLTPRDLFHLDMVIEGVERGKINMFDITRGKHEYDFSPEVKEILQNAYGKASNVVTQSIEDFGISKEWLENVSNRARKKGIIISEDWFKKASDNNSKKGVILDEGGSIK